MNERPRLRSWDDLEQFCGIKRNMPRSVTQRDVTNLTAQRLFGWPAWRRKFRKK